MIVVFIRVFMTLNKQYKWSCISTFLLLVTSYSAHSKVVRKESRIVVCRNTKEVYQGGEGRGETSLIQLLHTVQFSVKDSRK